MEHTADGNMPCLKNVTTGTCWMAEAPFSREWCGSLPLIEEYLSLYIYIFFLIIVSYSRIFQSAHHFSILSSRIIRNCRFRIAKIWRNSWSCSIIWSLYNNNLNKLLIDILLKFQITLVYSQMFNTRNERLLHFNIWK